MNFATYSKKDLAARGREFVRALNRKLTSQAIPDDDTEGWTEFVLDWFSARAGKGVLVDARRPRREESTRDTHGEFLCDLTHSTYPAYGIQGPKRFWRQEYWNEALENPCLVQLVLESEWGKARSPGATRVAVLHDAIKVATIKAKAKVVVFGPRDQEAGKALMKDLRDLRDSSGDDSPWLLVAVPWAEGQAWGKVLSRPPLVRRDHRATSPKATSLERRGPRKP